MNKRTSVRPSVMPIQFVDADEEFSQEEWAFPTWFAGFLLVAFLIFMSFFAGIGCAYFFKYWI